MAHSHSLCGYLVMAVLTCAFTDAGAQTVAADPPPPTEVERARIATERQGVQARLTRDEEVCSKKFAAQDCLNEARARHRADIADLRRQENSLKDAQRKQQGAQRLQRLDEKSAKAAAAPVAQSGNSATGQTQRLRQRAAKTGADSSSAQLADPPTNTTKPTRTAKRKSARPNEQAAQKHAQRIKQAQERRQKHAQELGQRKKPPAAPLPPAPPP